MMAYRTGKVSIWVFLVVLSTMHAGDCKRLVKQTSVTRESLHSHAEHQDSGRPCIDSACLKSVPTKKNRPPFGDAPELYKPLHGGGFTNRAAPMSPDPLAEYQWGPDIDTTPLQVYTMRPIQVAVQAGEVVGVSSLTTGDAKHACTCSSRQSF